MVVLRDALCLAWLSRRGSRAESCAPARSSLVLWPHAVNPGRPVLFRLRRFAWRGCISLDLPRKRLAVYRSRLIVLRHTTHTDLLWSFIYLCLHRLVTGFHACFVSILSLIHCSCFVLGPFSALFLFALYRDGWLLYPGGDSWSSIRSATLCHDIVFIAVILSILQLYPFFGFSLYLALKVYPCIFIAPLVAVYMFMSFVSYQGLLLVVFCIVALFSIPIHRMSIRAHAPVGMGLTGCRMCVGSS